REEPCELAWHGAAEQLVAALIGHEQHDARRRPRIVEQPALELTLAAMCERACDFLDDLVAALDVHLIERRARQAKAHEHDANEGDRHRDREADEDFPEEPHDYACGGTST